MDILGTILLAPTLIDDNRIVGCLGGEVVLVNGQECWPCSMVCITVLFTQASAFVKMIRLSPENQCTLLLCMSYTSVHIFLKRKKS